MGGGKGGRGEADWQAPYMKISENVEVWKTPGHTREDLTIIVRRVPSHGVVAIAGPIRPFPKQRESRRG